jgi:hypothetical protein
MRLSSNLQEQREFAWPQKFEFEIIYKAKICAVSKPRDFRYLSGTLSI